VKEDAMKTYANYPLDPFFVSRAVAAANSNFTAQDICICAMNGCVDRGDEKKEAFGI
jgi:hypothetical protein